MATMIGHVMSKIHASTAFHRLGDLSHGITGFRTDHATLDHTLTLIGSIDKTMAWRHRVCCYFVDFHKAFGIVTREHRSLSEHHQNAKAQYWNPKH